MTFNATYYPVAGVNDTNDLLSIFQFTSNDVTGGLFFPIMLLVIFVIQIIGGVSAGRPGSRTFVFAAFTATVLSIILGILALVEQRWVYLAILFVSLGVFWVRLAQSKE